MSEIPMQALPVPNPIPFVPAVTDPALPDAADPRPDTMPHRFARYPK